MCTLIFKALQTGFELGICREPTATNKRLDKLCDEGVALMDEWREEVNAWHHKTNAKYNSHISSRKRSTHSALTTYK
jgi:hypothetical protein